MCVRMGPDAPGRSTLRNRSLLRILSGFGLLNVSEWGFVAALSVYAFRTGGTLYVGLIGLRFLAGAVSSAMLAPLVAGRRGLLSQIALLRGCLLGGGGGDGHHPQSIRARAAVRRRRLDRGSLLPARAVAADAVTRSLAAGARAGGGGDEHGQDRRPGGRRSARGRGCRVRLAGDGDGGGGRGDAAGDALFAGRRRQFGFVDVEDSAHRLRKGLAAFPGVLRDKNAWPLVVASVLRTLVRGLWGALLVVVALHLLHSGDSSVGLMQASTGLGALVVLPLTATQIGRSRLALPCIFSFVAAGVAVGLVGAASALAVVAVLVFIWGAAMALADATSLSLLHRLLPTDAFSRTVAVMESLKLVTEGAGALLAPALVALFGLRAALVIAGLPLPVLMISTWVRVRTSDELAAGRGAVVARLHRVRLFRGLDMASLEQVAANTVPVEVQAGDEPITQGDRGDRFYVIESGTADVRDQRLQRSPARCGR